MAAKGSIHPCQLTRCLPAFFEIIQQQIASRAAAVSCIEAHGSMWRFLLTSPWFPGLIHTSPNQTPQIHAKSLHLSSRNPLLSRGHNLHLPATSSQACCSPSQSRLSPCELASATCQDPSASCQTAASPSRSTLMIQPHAYLSPSHGFATFASAQSAPHPENPSATYPTQSELPQGHSASTPTPHTKSTSSPPFFQQSSSFTSPPSNTSAKFSPPNGSGFRNPPGKSCPPTPSLKPSAPWPPSSNRTPVPTPSQTRTNTSVTLKEPTIPPKKRRVVSEKQPKPRKKFDIEQFFAEGGANKPWYQLTVELAVAEDQGYFLHPADINRIVYGCAMGGNHDAAFTLHRNYQDAKFWPGPYLGTRRKGDLAERATSILLGLLRNEQPKRAMALIGELGKDVGSQHVLFDRLLLQCARNGDASENARGDGVRDLTVEDGLRVVDEMVSNGLRPTRIGMESLIDCCDAALDAEMAEEIVRRMEVEYGLPPTVVTIVRLLRACVNADDEDRALRVLDRLPREDLKSRDVRLFVMQTLLLQYEHAAESREAAESPETMPRLRHKLDRILREESEQTGSILDL